MIKHGEPETALAPPVTIIGTGVCADDLTPAQQSIIAAADILVGGQRLLDGFGHLNCRRRAIDKDFSALVDFLRREMAGHRIVVLTSGDPLFFGIGTLLVRRLGADRVRILPNVSAVAAAFARLGEPWQEVHAVSLHGRSHTGRLLRYLADGEKVAVYTDPVHDPAWLGGLLVENALADVKLCVLERLGQADEKITRISPEQARSMVFADLNLVILTPDPERRHAPSLFPGMPDDWFAHSDGLITKAEVRAVSLSRLRLFDRAIFWDLGAGSGSVSIEAGRFVTRGEIFALEQNAERIRQIRENRARFGIGNLNVIHARLPDGLADLPDPHRVFIGGGGRRLAEIIRMAAGRLGPNGIIVINTVLIDNLVSARQALDETGFEVDTVQIQVNRSAAMPFSHRLQAANPVWIITGTRR
jgi:precorrin-6B C5,15-methyltransferase / cobalt-precorrin-6B C5,C15-methyltransferase